MGNICSRSKDETEAEPFARPGRVLGSSADSSAPRASVPANAKSKSHWQSPGRTLGGGGGGGGENANPGAGTGSGTGAVGNTDDARAKAAQAAQVGFVLFSHPCVLNCVGFSLANFGRTLYENGANGLLDRNAPRLRGLRIKGN